ncbi:putative vacuolar membrane transporter for cationic amino acids [Kickxella alabastrina]|uniref:Vacuolar membrane transporter for cationic amino acids n=1 Tax=Kickxella alabastrina TaxID=61397 RepID=A0ACC1IPR2_9FUNG|nr:putative vacuolar membrane transporter for cationic amino acids [Kickxella alabastrina]
MWLAGDFTDWYGAYVGRLLLPAILIALYFVITDVVLLAQMFIYRKSDDDAFGASQLPEGAERPPLLVRRGRRAIKYLGPNNVRGQMQEYRQVEHSTLIERRMIDQHQGHHHTYGAVASSASKPAKNNASKDGPVPKKVAQMLASLHEMGTAKTGRAAAISILVLFILLGLGVGSRIILALYPQHITDVVSQVFGYISAAMFFIAYIPQIAWNFTVQSTEGLSAGMFIFTVLGNVTYCMSIVSMSTDRDYLVMYAPWLAGALGTLGFEMLILWQCYFYYKPKDADATARNSDNGSMHATDGGHGSSQNGSASEGEGDDLESIISRRAHRRSRRRRYSETAGTFSRSRSARPPISTRHADKAAE